MYTGATPTSARGTPGGAEAGRGVSATVHIHVRKAHTHGTRTDELPITHYACTYLPACLPACLPAWNFSYPQKVSRKV